MQVYSLRMFVCLFALPRAGAGKTYTMLGTESDPGIMVLTLNSLFETIEDTSNDVIYRVTMAYMEVGAVLFTVQYSVWSKQPPV